MTLRESSPPRPSSMLDVQGSPRRRSAVVVGAGVSAAMLHVGAFALALTAGGSARHDPAPAKAPFPTQWVDVELPEPPPPTAAVEPEPDPAPEPPARRRRSRPPPPKKAPRAPAEPTSAPPPEAAQAGKVLAATEEEIVDFGNTFVMGDGPAYTGGTTEKGGTSKRAVRALNARAGGVEGGTGDDLDADLSRPPRLAGRDRWDCPFPREADFAGIDHATVGLRVEVNAQGEVTFAAVTSDPGHGFAREARECALSKRWDAGRDRAGRPRQAVARINVRFVR